MAGGIPTLQGRNPAETRWRGSSKAQSLVTHGYISMYLPSKGRMFHSFPQLLIQETFCKGSP